MKKVILSEEEKKEILQLHSFKRKINESVVFDNFEAWANNGNIRFKKDGWQEFEYELSYGWVGITVTDVSNKNGEFVISWKAAGSSGTSPLGAQKLKSILKQMPNAKEIEFTSADGKELTLEKVE